MGIPTEIRIFLIRPCKVLEEFLENILEIPLEEFLEKYIIQLLKELVQKKSLKY